MPPISPFYGVKFASNVLSGTGIRRKMVPQRQILHSYLKWRHVRDDTLGFWIIPCTPPARNKFPTARSRLALRSKKKRGASRIWRFRERRKLAKVSLIRSKYDGVSHRVYPPLKRFPRKLSRVRTYFT